MGKGALLLWEPMPEIFPSLMSGWLGLPLALHNRYFAAVNNYSSAYTFLTVPGVDMALPVDEGMFTHIMSKAQAWGMVQYEQDWLNDVYDTLSPVTKGEWRLSGERGCGSMLACHSHTPPPSFPHLHPPTTPHPPPLPARVRAGNITAASDWLTAMANAAAGLGVTIQYCMALPKHILHSTTSQVVTNARASGDYHPGQDNWEIGLSALFYGAVGIAPSKDDWWTTETQPGSPYSDKPTEPNWQLQAIVVGTSTGEWGPAGVRGVWGVGWGGDRAVGGL